MEAWVWFVVVVALVALAAAIAWWAYRRRRSTELRERFGSEYERTIAAAESRHEAERDLETRREQRERLRIRPLDRGSRERFASAWRDVQARFAETPAVALAGAQELAVQVMRERGYPVDDFERQVAVVSVDHPDVVTHFRAGHAIVERATIAEADTEELRQGLMHYRVLFDRLLEDAVPVTGGDG